MRALAALVVFGGLAFAQSEDWRAAFMELPERPTANLQDIQRFERSLTMAMPYFAAFTPGDYEANRELIRRITMYNAALEMMSRDPQISRDPQMRAAFSRTRRVYSQIRFAYPMGIAGQQQAASGLQNQGQQAQQAKPANAVHEPPFALMAPRLGKVAAADVKVASELCARYDSDASKAAAAWQSAETLRVSLEGRGMSLNVQTATAVSRLQLYFDSAATALKESDWEEARTNLTRAEGETEKIFKTVGR